MGAMKNRSLIVLFACLVSFPLTVQADRSTVEDGMLVVPRIDIDGYGAMEIAFRIVFDDEYRLVLESAVETSATVSNSGVYDPVTGRILIDEVELTNGELYSVELEQLAESSEPLFAVVEAIALDPEPAPVSSSPSNTTAESSAAAVLFTEQCSSCHGDNGAGTAIAPSLIACASCGSFSSLMTTIRDTMPLGQTDACDSDCSEALAGYIQTAFNSSNQQVKIQTVGFIQQLGDLETLRRVSQQLVSRLPTLEEHQLVSSDGDAGFMVVIDGMMGEENFYRRLSEIFNDYLLTDKYHSSNGSEAAINLLSRDDFPDRRWFDPGKESRGENYDLVRRRTNDAVAREPLELINYVVRNNRPFTEILTADYMMVSPESARSYGVSGVQFHDPQNPNEFQPARLAGIPHAGILTSPMFLNRYPTTSTNRNRGRARVVFDLFLDTDILAIEGVRPGNSVDITTPVPTINNPQCSKCHSVLDPVASIFQNWDYKGRYRPARENKYGWYTDMEPRGFNGVTMPLAGNIDSSVSWLGQQIAVDAKFPRAVTRIMVNGLTGKEPLEAPVDASSNPLEYEAYIAQRTVLNEIQDEFVRDNYNLKTLVREIIMSPYWRASGLDAQASTVAHLETGSRYLLSPEQLNRKIVSLFGFDWRNSLDQYYKDRNKSWASKLENTFHQIYGGIDSDSITTRLKSPNGLMGAMQLRMANELACYVVPHEFWLPQNQRRMFLYVDEQSNPYDESGDLNQAVVDSIRQNIQYLHQYLLAEALPLDSNEIQITMDLYMSVINRGRQHILNSGGEWRAVRLPDMCDRTKDFNGVYLKDVNGEDLSLQMDNHFVIRAWMAVVAYLLADYKFLYS